jgi:hypothetical protein
LSYPSMQHNRHPAPAAVTLPRQASVGWVHDPNSSDGRLPGWNRLYSAAGRAQLPGYAVPRSARHYGGIPFRKHRAVLVLARPPAPLHDSHRTDKPCWTE